MMRIWLVVGLFAAVAASAECRPEGRKQFAEGLEALARGNLAVAAAQFTALVQAQPDCAEARNNLAVVQVEQGRLGEAIVELRRALELRPDYDRARVNLQRVEILLAERAQPTPQPAPTAPAAALETAAFPGATATVAQPVAQAAAAEPTATAGEPALPAGVAGPRSEGARVGVIDLEKRQVCLYARTAGGIAPPSCYSISNHRIESLPQWLLTGDTGGQRLRLLDETGQPRLKIVPEPAAVAGDVVWLKAADWDRLAATVMPWRTIWGVVQNPISPLEPSIGRAIGEALEQWRSAWEQKQLDAYAAMYSQAFRPQSDATMAQWRARKRTLFDKSGSISVQIEAPSIFVIDAGATVITLFEQRYRSTTAADNDLKALRWKREDGAWKISVETVLKQFPATEPADK
jgi:tetratricopeptide (TPR) repeat protein